MNDAARKLAMGSLEHAPYAARLKLKIISSENGEAIAKLPFSENILNGGGSEVPIHGGAIASLADFAACAAVWSLPETQRSMTISMTVNFTGPGIKSDLTARAMVRRKGKRVASLNVEIRDDAEALIADALVTYKIA
ncbi:MAG TPA: PaaI family thioesterase [Candidatus Binataceae bacterium]|nr:PaaI family thioesterase [Candidatus Binataceae bacterium]